MLPGQPRILLIAPAQSYRIGAYVDAARALGMAVEIASPGRHSLMRELAQGPQIDLHDPLRSLDSIAFAARSTPYVGIIPTDDATLELAAQAAARLGLSYNSVRSARLARRKDLARECLRQAGVPVPQHRVISLVRDPASQIDDFTFPCVVKPLSLSASRGVIRANDPAQFVAACARIQPIIADQPDPFESSHLLAEAYIEGEEVALEGFLSHGLLRVLALFDKPEPLRGPFFEETYYITPSRLSWAIQRRIHARVADACAAYGLIEGPVHAELRIAGGEAWILEVAGRTIGGECGSIFSLASSQSIEALVVASAVGRPPPAVGIEGAAGVLMIPIPKPGMLRRCDGVAEASRVRHIQAVRISAPPGHELVTLPEGSSYLGFIFSRAETAAQAEAALREAHGKLSFKIDPVWHLN